MHNMLLQGEMELKEMSSRNHLPIKCLECAKSTKPFIHGSCNFCQELRFQEEVLCYLNQSTQNPNFFECHAFQPLLKVIGSPGQENQTERKALLTEITIENLVDSDKIKYQRALALQKLARNPDDVMLEIKYHFAWNVIGRKPIFLEPANAIDCISDTITSCSDAVRGFASFLWLAPDHLHYYVESDGEVSPDNIAEKIKSLLEASILDRSPDLNASPELRKRLWDKAYFVETIG